MYKKANNSLFKHIKHMKFHEERYKNKNEKQ
jgi:hypothetical protein